MSGLVIIQFSVLLRLYNYFGFFLLAGYIIKPRRIILSVFTITRHKHTHTSRFRLWAHTGTAGRCFFFY